MYETRKPQLPTSGQQQPSTGTKRNRRLFQVALGATLVSVVAVPTLAEAAPSSARQIERWALETVSTADEPVPTDVDGTDIRDADPVAVPGPEVLRIECDAPGAVAGKRVRIGCRWTLPTDAPVRQLTLWRSVDGAARERVATFGWPFENSYRDVVAAETQHVAYAIIGTDGNGELVARSRADWVRLPTTPDTTVPAAVPVRPESAPVVTPVEPAPLVTVPAATDPAATVPTATVPVSPDAVRPTPPAPSTTLETRSDVVEPQRPTVPSRPTPTRTSTPSADAEATQRGDAG